MQATNSTSNIGISTLLIDAMWQVSTHNQRRALKTR